MHCLIKIRVELNVIKTVAVGLSRVLRYRHDVMNHGIFLKRIQNTPGIVCS